MNLDRNGKMARHPDRLGADGGLGARLKAKGSMLKWGGEWRSSEDGGWRTQPRRCRVLGRTDFELLIRRTVFGGRGRFLMASEAFSRSKSIGWENIRHGLPGRNVAGFSTLCSGNVTP